MKKQIGSVVVLSVALLGSYYITGLVAEHTIKKNIDALDASRGLNLHLLSYHRGFFFSDMVLDSQIQTPERFVKGASGQMMLVPSKTYQIEVPVRLYHGPLTFTSDGVHVGLGYANSEILLPSPYAEKFKKQYTEQSVSPVLDVKLWVTMTNKMKLFVNIPHFQLISKQDNSQLEWDGMTSEHLFSSGMKKLEGEVQLNKVSMVQGTETAELETLVSTYNLHNTEQGLYVGDVSLSIPKVVLSNAGASEFDMKALKIASSSDIANGFFDSSFHFSFDTLLSNGKTYGPGRMTFTIKHLDAAVLADINDKINQAQKSKVVQPQQAAIAILPDIPKLLAKGASIELSEMNVMGPEGEIDGVLKLALPDNTEMKNPFQLIQRIEGEGKLKVSAILLREFLVKTTKSTTDAGISSQNEVKSSDAVAVIAKPIDVKEPSLVLDEKIDHLLKTGAIVQKGSDYVIDIRLSSGQLSVNGRPLSAEMLQF